MTRLETFSAGLVVGLLFGLAIHQAFIPAICEAMNKTY